MSFLLLLPASLSCASKLTLNFNIGSTKLRLCFNRFFFAIQSSSPTISDRFSKLNMKTEMIFNIMFYVYSLERLALNSAFFYSKS